MRLIPLLLCWLSGAALAADLPALVVSPDLLRGEPAVQRGGRAASAAPRVQSGGAPAAIETQTREREIKSQAVQRVETPATQTRPAAAPGAASAAKPATGSKPGATEVSALRISGTRAVELVADGEAELKRGELLLTADKLVYREPTDEAVAEGNVRLRQGRDEMTGPAATIVLGDQTGSFDTPRYSITRPAEPLEPGDPPREISGGGHADMLYFEGENQYRAKNATWSTCSVDDPDWYIKAGDLALDYDRDMGVARDSTVVFQGVPLFWMPWTEFPLAGQRQSGVLPPTFGTSNKTGFDLAVPYYWNIAPNYDATITPRWMSRRGMQVGGEIRYLGDSYRGEARAEYLARDNLTGSERALGSLQHQQWITPTLYGSLDINAVSDDAYFEDLSSRVSVASKVNLLREGRLVYAGSPWWSASALVQAYQTLSPDADKPLTTPYRRLPQLLLNASRPDLVGGFVFGWQSELTRFSHPDKDKPEATRISAYPQLSLPFERAGYYITPKVGVNYTGYEIDRSVASSGLRDSITRTVPIFSVDSGMTFERDAAFFGHDFVQTLEPRLYYLNAAYRRQDEIPLFDTSRYDFGFAQIFSENLYTGGDRIADANQLTAAVTSRLIDPVSGAERMKVLLGQRYYFNDQRVTLNYYDENGNLVQNEIPRTSRRADMLAGFSGRVTQDTSLESLWQYNPRDHWTERFNTTFRFQPGFAKALNLSYRYAKDILRDVDVSGQWPMGGGWYGVTRLTHSLREDRLTEAIGGVEYDGGCWVVRVAMHRFATSADEVTKAFFVQLELNDLASIGTSPVSLIKRSVPGYGKINEPGSNRVFGVE
ncbi:LPS-assembly protein LptD [Azoarcus sp. L1K30]|uniref:LPS-assembly protein LptD n=1 Tax=Azoarcus sp. L1K30 TaxID=2820277 RepID=UPI001B81F7FB|nr:LPS-assembly protein LptD [Azoarcus sp. L1K30]MBR0566409.1 LPS-assembly protein LptD [Azoarcus sp. L1K30]